MRRDMYKILYSVMFNDLFFEKTDYGLDSFPLDWELDKKTQQNS